MSDAARPSPISRRALLRTGALVAAAASLGGFGRRSAARAADPSVALSVEEATIADLQAAMASGRLTAVDLVDVYVSRIQAIDWNGPKLRSVLEINPDARDIARALDEERRGKGPRGPLHGIPVLLKD